MSDTITFENSALLKNESLKMLVSRTNQRDLTSTKVD